jgi:hypothetical protein
MVFQAGAPAREKITSDGSYRNAGRTEMSVRGRWCQNVVLRRAEPRVEGEESP